MTHQTESCTLISSRMPLLPMDGNNMTTTVPSSNNTSGCPSGIITPAIGTDLSLCFGCGDRIRDRFLLRVSPNLQWHAQCLKCSECGMQLDEKCTCFVRSGKPYCKPDYIRLFGATKCCKCQLTFTKCDFVMRAQQKVFHVQCFRCDACARHLLPGEQFALRDDSLLCRADFEQRSSSDHHHLSLFSCSASPPPNHHTTLLTSPAPSNQLLSSLPPVPSSIACALTSASTPTEMKTLTPTLTGSCRANTPLSATSAPLSGPTFSSLGLEPLLPHDLNTSHSVSPGSNSNSSSGLASYSSNTEFASVGQSASNRMSLSMSQSHLSAVGSMHSNGLTCMSNSANNSSSNMIGSVCSESNSSSRTSNGSNGPTCSNPGNGLNTVSSSDGRSSHGGGSGGGGRSSSHHNSHKNGEHKPTRIRTVLSDKQLATLRTCYNANPRPDALMKEQLVEMTGLSPRVIRVWFQNKRCKDKKKNILMKQLQQQEKDGRQMQTIASMRGIPLVAMSPVRHDSPVQNYVDVQAYEPPWGKIAEYAMHGGDCDQNNPHFQHLVGQIHGYDHQGQMHGSMHNTASMSGIPPHMTSLNHPDAQLPNSANQSAALTNSNNNNNNNSNPLTSSTLSTFDTNDLCRPESVLSAIRADTPSELSCASD